MQVGQEDIYEGARVYRFGVVPGRFLDNLCEIEGSNISLDLTKVLKISRLLKTFMFMWDNDLIR